MPENLRKHPVKKVSWLLTVASVERLHALIDNTPGITSMQGVLDVLSSVPQDHFLQLLQDASKVGGSQ